jgi:hypothetical protein
MANELVEKVKRILSDNECQKYSVTAPAVIKAVAEWLKEDLGTDWCATGDNLFLKLMREIE